MDSQLVQRTRYQLQSRVRTVKTCPIALFGMHCGHFLDWVFAHPVLNGALASLGNQIEHFESCFSEDIAKFRSDQEAEIWRPRETASRTESVALSVAALKYARKIDLNNWKDRQGFLVAMVATAYAPPARQNPNTEGIVEALRDVCVQSVYDFLDEAIDSRNAVLGLLVKYKTRCEMYRRNRLREAATVGLEGRRSERALAFDLYEYLHDQGVDFWIESVSASGEPDVVSQDTHGERLVADAKYIDDETNVRKTVTSGFRQVLEYCRDHNEPVGYLVVFVNQDVVIDIKAERDDGFPCFRTGGYTIYYVIIDIFEHKTSASKRPKPTVIEFTQQDVVSSLQSDD